jgi:hypothetical protein
MTTSEIIAKFELFVDDSTELSASEELDLLNQVYRKIFINRPWEFSKKSVSGSISGLEVTLPTDFAYLYPNYQHTDNTVSSQQNSSPTVIFTGSAHNPIKVVNYSDRRQYLNSSGYAYIDIRNGNLVFTAQPNDTTYEFDYVFVPTSLVSGEELPIPMAFNDLMSKAIFYGMCVEDMTIQLFDKARSYAKENQDKMDSYLRDMAYVNARLNQY